MAAVGKHRVFGPYLTDGGALEDSIVVYHYSAGTLTLKDVYTDHAKTTTAAQPVPSDSTGVVSFYADGLYKYIVKDGDGNQLYAWDNVDDQGRQEVGEGSAVASAATLTLGNQYDYDFFHVTGTTTITALAGNQARVTLVFDGACILTHGASSLILMGAVDYLTVAGDVFVFLNDGSNVWREESRQTTGGFWRADYGG